MNSTKDIFKASIVDAGRNFPWDDKQPDRERQFWISILKALTIVMAEPVYVIFRRNFGKKGIDLIYVIIAFFVLCLVSFAIVYSVRNHDIDVEYGSPISYLITGAFLSTLAFATLFRGIHHSRHPKDDSKYTGDNFLLSFLEKGSNDNEYIKLFVEPFIVLAIGIAYCFFNVWGGIVVIFCALSVWARMALDHFYLGNPIQDKINSQSVHQSKGRSISRVS